MKAFRCLIILGFVFSFASCSTLQANKQDSQLVKEEASMEGVAPDVKDDFKKKGYKPITGKLSDFELARYQYCGDDRDCIVVNNGCCDCANGSPDVSINKARLADFKARFACIDVYCKNKTPDPICGSGVVSCINHKCKYFAPGEGNK